MDVPLCSCGALLLNVGGEVDNAGSQGDGFFRGKRYLCMKCGALYANAPRKQAATPEAEAKIMALESEFMTNCGSKLFHFGLYRHGCEACDRDEEHIQHASDRDWRRLNDALKWLSDRTGKEFGMVNGDLGHFSELMSATSSPTDPRSITDLLRDGI